MPVSSVVKPTPMLSPYIGGHSPGFFRQPWDAPSFGLNGQGGDGRPYRDGAPFRRFLDVGLRRSARVKFGNELDIRGPHPSLFVPDLAPYYCPA
jgi:hypothetical protein